MLTIITTFHILAALAIVALVLLQQGKGADAGAAFGAGGSGTVFGARGAASFLTRATAVLALVFFLTSLGLAAWWSAPRSRSNPTGRRGSRPTCRAPPRTFRRDLRPATEPLPAGAAPSDIPGADVPPGPSTSNQAAPGAYGGSGSAAPGHPVPGLNHGERRCSFPTRA